jgi:epoxyqueuosine reductase
MHSLMNFGIIVPMSLADETKHRALELGFDLVGVTDASPVDAGHVQFFADWLKSGFAGQMNYMHRNFEKRINPAALLQGAQSVICVGLNYKPTRQTPPKTKDPAGKVAVYAQYEDYHTFMKKRLRALVKFISATAGPGHKYKICVDSVPLAERALAARAGLGFIGKNHTLINPTLGSQVFLGEIVTTVQLEPDEFGSHDSGQSEESGQRFPSKRSACTNCIEACPTGALRPDGQFDANRCISYLTIEYKGQIPGDLAAKIGARLFGCDECVLACPYQQDAPACTNGEFGFHSDRAKLDLRRILNMRQQEFDAQFADSVIKRLGLQGLKRNARICLENM